MFCLEHARSGVIFHDTHLPVVHVCAPIRVAIRAACTSLGHDLMSGDPPVPDYVIYELFRLNHPKNMIVRLIRKGRRVTGRAGSISGKDWGSICRHISFVSADLARTDRLLLFKGINRMLRHE